MDGLSAFGLFAVTAMFVCYALEQRSPWFILAFAGSCGLGSVFGFLQGVAVWLGRGHLGAGSATSLAPRAIPSGFSAGVIT